MGARIWLGQALAEKSHFHDGVGAGGGIMWPMCHGLNMFDLLLHPHHLPLTSWANVRKQEALFLEQPSSKLISQRHFWAEH